MKNEKRILVVDDDPSHREMLKTLVSGWGYRVELASDGPEGVEMVREVSFDIVLMDMRMIQMSGMAALEEIKAYNPSLPVIMMTAYSSVETAVASLKKGAYDYLTKPLDFEKLKLTLERIIETMYLKNENRSLKETLGETFSRQNIIGSSKKMTDLLHTVELAAPTDANILICGESGTGKELIAGAVHYNSPRKDYPFIKINCAAITETLLESELFGHRKGAFTGADKTRKGMFQKADKGSILLDEIGEMGMPMQAKLLRVIQEKEVTPVGDEKSIPVDVRIIASTNKDLKVMSDKGSFREDLFFRLNVVRLEMPPLRDRPEDIPALALQFLESFALKNNRDIRDFTPDAMDAMIRYQWPGNVRELMNCVERAVVLARHDNITAADLPFGGQETADSERERPDLYDRPLSEIEKQAILRTLESTGGNRSEAARRLGITRKTLLKKIKDYGVT